MGVTDDALLAHKKGSTDISPLNERKRGVRDYLACSHPGLKLDIVTLDDQVPHTSPLDYVRDMLTPSLSQSLSHISSHTRPPPPPPPPLSLVLRELIH